NKLAKNFSDNLTCSQIKVIEPISKEDGTHASNASHSLLSVICQHSSAITRYIFRCIYARLVFPIN
ncbi:hypothetical protein, partial [Klebsiella quasipneumoniae]|uniref:hypothetical protein n=1 Tax=Klebsiella quasipneumoniae TaxID=1463165 RepID=UPI001CFD294D